VSRKATKRELDRGFEYLKSIMAKLDNQIMPVLTFFVIMLTILTQYPVREVKIRFGSVYKWCNKC